jgi:glycosyltransferase involved in cell wall biosynthesis
MRIFHKECATLAMNGFDVVLLTLRGKSREEKGVRIIGMEKDTMTRAFRFFNGPRLLLRKALEIDAEVYHLHDPELLQIAKCFKNKGKRVIYDAHEDLPQQIYSKHYLPPLFRKLVSGISRLLLHKVSKHIDAVVAATDVIRESFQARVPYAITLKNYPIDNELIEATSMVEKKDDAVCYIGGIFRERGIFQMLDAIEPLDVKLYLAGAFSPASLYEEACAHPAWPKVVFYGYVDRKQIGELLRLSKVGLVLLHPLQSYKDSLPVKLFEYMAAGIPVIASDFVLWKTIIDDSECGLCVDPLDILAIREAISTLLNSPELCIKYGSNARKAVLSTYNWRNEEEKLLGLYHKIFGECFQL